jgi:protein disulfide-isomerase
MPGGLFPIDPKSLEKIKINTKQLEQIVAKITKPEWYKHAAGFNNALKLASKTQSRILVAFTVLEVDMWCKKLKQDVFDDPDFGWWAWNKWMLLVNIDFNCYPWQLCNQPADDMALLKQYAVDTFPTVIIFNSEGKECGRLVGYLSGGVLSYTTQLEVNAKLNATGGPCRPSL